MGATLLTAGLALWGVLSLLDSSSEQYDPLQASMPVSGDPSGGVSTRVARVGDANLRSVAPGDLGSSSPVVIGGGDESLADLIIQVEAPPGRSASGALVVIDRWNGIEHLEAERTIADSGGAASIQTRPGPLNVFAWGQGYFGELSTFALPGENGELLIRCWSRESVVGRVVDERGTPISGARVWIEVYGSEARTVSDADGSFRLDALPGTGQWQVLHVDSPMHGQESALIRVESEGVIQARLVATDGSHIEGFHDSDRPLVIALRSASAVSGRVIDNLGLAVSEAQVDAHGHYSFGDGMGLLERREAQVAEDGSFSLGGLRSDITHVLRIKAPGFGTQSFELPPLSASLEGLLVTLHPEIRLDVLVRTADGWPAEGLDVSLRSLDSQLPLLGVRPPDEQRDMRAPFTVVDDARCDAKGVVSFAGLHPGRYQAKVSRQGRRIQVEEVELFTGNSNANLTIDLSDRTLTMRAVAHAADGRPFTERLYFVRDNTGFSITPREGGLVVVAGVSPAQIHSYEVLTIAGAGGMPGGYLELESGERLPFAGPGSRRR